MISLVIPVYNKAPFLRRCLDSVASQLNKDIEVIVVDDGSTDGSRSICIKYAKKYGWKLYKTAHAGVSEARNLGIDKAQGDYIAFLDADDALAFNSLRVMVKIAEGGQNIYQFGQFRGKTFDTVNYNPSFSPKGFYKVGDIPRYWVLVWNKLYKISFLLKKNLRFKKGMQFGEDTVFNAECILANGGLHHEEPALVVHSLDDQESLCRGKSMSLDRICELDNALLDLLNKQTEQVKVDWLIKAINEHRHSKLYRRMGFRGNELGRYDVVYFLKDTKENEELRYSLRSIEENWQYRRVWFCGGCPVGVEPDRNMRIKQEGIDKWNKVRNMIRQVCENDEITEDFWLFNDDFYVLTRIYEDIPPTYNGELLSYIERIERKIGGPDGYTERLRYADAGLKQAGLMTRNYEVHKPMLINRKKALEVLDKFPNYPAFRSLYGNYWQIGGENRPDRKVKILNYKNMDLVRFWDFLSTSDKSFKEGNIGEFVRNRFPIKSRYERSKND